MVSKVQHSVIGVEISDDRVIMAQMILNEELPLVNKLASYPLQAAVVKDGLITDMTGLVDVLSKALSEDGWVTRRMVMAVTRVPRLKCLEQLLKVTEDEIVDDLDDRVIKSPLFQEQAYSLGYQFPRGDDAQEFSRLPVLYAAVPEMVTDTLKEVVDMLDAELMAVDLVSLATVRSMMFQSLYTNEMILTVTLFETNVDFNIVYKGNYLFTHSTRFEYAEIESDPVEFDAFVNAVRSFVLAFHNSYPQYGSSIQRVLVSTRCPKGQSFFERLKAALVNFDVYFYTPESTISFSKELRDGAASADLLLSATPAVGLALKYFEKYRQTLGLIKARRQIDPIFSRFELALSGGVLAVFLSIFFVVSMVLGHQADSVLAEVDGIKSEINSLNTGAYKAQQDQLDHLQSRIDLYHSLQSGDASKTEFFQDFVKRLPGDMTISRIAMGLESDVSFKGISESEESVLTFFNYLKERYQNVKLGGLVVAYRKDGSQFYNFSMSFEWR